jgi:hypothetical protein
MKISRKEGNTEVCFAFCLFTDSFAILYTDIIKSGILHALLSWNFLLSSSFVSCNQITISNKIFCACSHASYAHSTLTFHWCAAWLYC